MKRLWLLLLCITITLPAFAHSGTIDERMQNIASELRCLVCQNESISESRSDFAVDLRERIREQVRAGHSDKEIRQYMVARYGEFILYRPPLKASTLLLWFGPLLLLVLALIVLLITLRRQKHHHHRGVLLSDIEQEKAEALLKHTFDNGNQP